MTKLQQYWKDPEMDSGSGRQSDSGRWKAVKCDVLIWDVICERECSHAVSVRSGRVEICFAGIAKRGLGRVAFKDSVQSRPW